MSRCHSSRVVWATIWNLSFSLCLVQSQFLGFSEFVALTSLRWGDHQHYRTVTSRVTWSSLKCDDLETSRQTLALSLLVLRNPKLCKKNIHCFASSFTVASIRKWQHQKFNGGSSRLTWAPWNVMFSLYSKGGNPVCNGERSSAVQRGSGDGRGWTDEASNTDV